MKEDQSHWCHVKLNWIHLSFQVVKEVHECHHLLQKHLKEIKTWMDDRSTPEFFCYILAGADFLYSLATTGNMRGSEFDSRWLSTAHCQFWSHCDQSVKAHVHAVPEPCWPDGFYKTASMRSLFLRKTQISGQKCVNVLHRHANTWCKNSHDVLHLIKNGKKKPLAIQN